MAFVHRCVFLPFIRGRPDDHSSKLGRRRYRSLPPPKRSRMCANTSDFSMPGNATQSQNFNYRHPRTPRNQLTGKERILANLNHQISSCARKRDYIAAIKALQRLDENPLIRRNVITYNSVINVMVVCKQHALAQQHWDEMVQAGIQPSLITFNTMLKSCFGGSNDDVERAHALLDEMKRLNIKPDRVTFNSLINVLVAAGQMEDAQEVYQQMRASNIEPDSYTFCTLAKQARAEKDVSMLDALLLHLLNHHATMQQTQSNSPILRSPEAYNAVANGYIRCKHPIKALQMLERMKTHEKNGNEPVGRGDREIPVQPDVHTFNVKIKALRESAAPVQRGLDVLQELRNAGLEEDWVTIITLIDYCCQRGDMKLAERLLENAKLADIEYESRKDVPYSSMRSSRGSMETGKRRYRDSYRYSKLGRALKFSQRINKKPPRFAKTSTNAFNALLRGYTSGKFVDLDKAIMVYREMEEFAETHGFLHCLPDRITFTHLLNGCALMGDIDKADDIISQMEERGVCSIVPYNAYLKACRGRPIETILGTLERIRNDGLRPDLITYNTIIDSLVNEEDAMNQIEILVLDKMPKEGLEPDLHTFNTIIKVASRQRANSRNPRIQLESAQTWFEELQTRGLRPDEYTYQGMLSACAAVGESQAAVEYFRKLQAFAVQNLKEENEKGDLILKASGLNKSEIPELGKDCSRWTTSVLQVAYVTLMRAFLASNMKDRVESVLMIKDEMLACGLHLNHAGYTAVADAYAVQGNIAGVDSTLSAMVESNSISSRPSDAFGLSLVHHGIRLKALCNAGRLDDAYKTLRSIDGADTVMFNTIIFACLKQGEREVLNNVVKLMEIRRLKPDVLTNRALRKLMGNMARTLKAVDGRMTSAIAHALQVSAIQHISIAEEDDAIQTAMVQ